MNPGGGYDLTHLQDVCLNENKKKKNQKQTEQVATVCTQRHQRATVGTYGEGDQEEGTQGEVAPSFHVLTSVPGASHGCQPKVQTP